MYSPTYLQHTQFLSQNHLVKISKIIMVKKLNLNLLSYKTLIQNQIFGDQHAKFRKKHLQIFGENFPHVKNDKNCNTEI